MGFPILKIPVVALKVLLDHLNNVELLTVSLLSKRADWILMACGKKNVSFFNLPDSEINGLCKIAILEFFLLESRRRGKLPYWNFVFCCSVSSDQHIEIRCIHFNLQIYFETLEDIEKFGGIKRNLKIGDSFVPVGVTQEKDEVEKIRAFWNTKTHGMIVFMDFFKTNLNLPIQKLSFAGEDSRAIRAVVKHINSTQTVVENALVCVYPPVSEDDFKFILRNVSVTGEFPSQLTLSRNFRFNEKIRAKNIQIRFGHWFTLQNLLKCNENETIHVRGSKFTAQELRTFLKEWQSYKFPKLENVSLTTEESAFDVTKYFEIRKDKSNNTSGRQVQVIRGPGDSYGAVYSIEGFFQMSVHNG
ncbi:hypothetical protein CAEBREN_06179 [Caenorhabditis brenneri]|uniref:F-box domain-containing protein n=1 Tax=Caenorhabditis brenneri TaxID=135651 RepID=G0NPI0_CAEBE|nr:hypothetical protein CAEBREN_06179 [Caenorhabditis brenneri]